MIRLFEDIFDIEQIEAPDSHYNPSDTRWTPTDDPGAYQFSMTVFAEMINVNRITEETGYKLTELCRRVKDIFSIFDCCVCSEPYLTVCCNCGEPSWKPVKQFGEYDYVNNPTALSKDKAPGIHFHFNMTTKNTQFIGRAFYAIMRQAAAMFKSKSKKPVRIWVYRRKATEDDFASLFTLTPEESRRTCIECAERCLKSEPDFYQDTELVECLHPLNNIPYLLREDIMDDIDMDEISDNDRPVDDEAAQNGLYNFRISMSVGICPDEDTPNLDIKSLSKILKQLVHYIKNSPVFRDSVIDNVKVYIRCDELNDKRYFNMSYDEYIEQIPDFVFNVPVIKDCEHDYNERLFLSIKMEFSAQAEFRSPNDIYSFFKMMLPRQKGFDTFFDVFPPDFNKEKAKHLQFRKWVDGSFTTVKGKFEEGYYVSIWLTHEHIGDNAFNEFYWLFLDEDRLDMFKEYLERNRKKLNEFPYNTIENLSNGIYKEDDDDEEDDEDK